ncbi:MAG: hypothetical protein M3408_08655 [Actinomycetota bacterium]|nr:hypothetical protein [Pseudonocardiales bacterium]MDQ3601302.1 hypothetical protein [Actinomycetota bacterium]
MNRCRAGGRCPGRRAAPARHQLPDATSQINILSRVGGALGNALFVVILTQDRPADAR